MLCIWLILVWDAKWFKGNKHSEHWELTSETTDGILGHSEPGSGFTARQTDSGVPVLFTLYSSRAIEKNISYILKSKRKGQWIATLKDHIEFTWSAYRHRGKGQAVM